MDEATGYGLSAAFDQAMMRLALEQAAMADALGEVPVGAVITEGETVVATGFNRPIGLNDPSAHAEIQVIRAAAEIKSNYRLPGLTLYVTLEPCAMCAGAIFHSRLSRVVYGARDLKTGVHQSTVRLFDEARLNHHAQIEHGVLEGECGAALSEFFAKRRLGKLT